MKRVKIFLLAVFGLLAACSKHPPGGAAVYDSKIEGHVGSGSSNYVSVTVDAVLYGSGVKKGSVLQLNRRTPAQYQSLDSVRSIEEGGAYELLLKANPDGSWAVIMAEPVKTASKSDGVK